LSTWVTPCTVHFCVYICICKLYTTVLLH
jgi:hypothetical protein